jgi:hypothetical protein
MTKRQKTMRHLVTCMTRHRNSKTKKEKYYWNQQIKKGLIIVNIKPWSI